MGCCASAPKAKQLTFLVIGLDNSGKTTLTRTIAGGAAALPSKCCSALSSASPSQLFLSLSPLSPSLPAPLSDADPFIVPTMGFSAPIHKRLFGWDVVFYDLGGGARIRGVWPQYFADVHGLIYVVDSSDASRLPEAAKELHAALEHPMVVGKPTLM
jgi:GTPase SAR1 family protein